MAAPSSIVSWSRIVLIGFTAVFMGFNWTALQLVAWAGMTAQNAKTMDWETAFERAVAGQQSCMICRLIDDRQNTGESESAATGVQGLEIEGVLYTAAILVSHPQDMLQQAEYFNPPMNVHTAPQPPPPQRAA